FLAMELLEGRPLHHRLREGPVEPSQAIAIAEQVCRSLREAHGLGLVHRDLKPANIFLENLTAEEHPHVKVLDFGLVKDLAVADDMTQTGLFMGSPKYMSPEQATSGPTDARSDVYSLGVTLYQMLTGKLPFEREGSVNLLMAHIQDPPPPFAERAPDVTVPAALERVVRRCLEKRPKDRFPSMNALLQVLKQTAQDLGYRAGALDGSLSGSASFVAPAMVDTAPAPRPHRRLLGAGLALAALLLVVLVVALSVGDADPAANASSTEVPPPAAEPLGDDAPAGEAEPAMEADPVPARRVVLVGLRSQPAGAEVRIGDTDEVYGPTPALLEWSGADAQPGRQVTFRFTLEGHQPFTVTRTLRGDTLEVDASLVPLPEPERRPRVRTPRRPRPVPSAMMDRAQPATPSLGDYRDDPY
ncbi:MAG: serine/threonine-protein kinase, partial [Myxococcota bacterium]